MTSSTTHADATARTASHLKIRNAENSIANGASVMATSTLVRKSSLSESANARRLRRKPHDRKDDRLETTVSRMAATNAAAKPAAIVSCSFGESHLTRR